ncbi:MAG: general secretion pathway protein GspK [Pirellulales bacterium]|nr:general secretion pathway protein GspK [Pirellulales bacterium]
MPFHPTNADRRGSVLLLVLIVVAVITLASFTFFDLMFNHRRSSETHGQQVQATLLAESGVEYLLNLLGRTEEEIEDAGGLFDNPGCFQGVLVMDNPDARARGRFAIVAPNITPDGYLDGVRFGLEDESTRLNLNTLLIAEAQLPGSGRELLMTLPGMTESIADAILDWLDEDDTPREFGAEREHYSALSPGYAPTNGPLTTVEELLLVRDVTPELLFGADVNHNGMIDPNEEGRVQLVSVDNSDGAMNRGWSAYLTIHSAERNLRPDGTPKIDVNMEDLEELHSQISEVLGPDAANYIVAYRQGGPFDGAGEGKPASSVTIDLRQPARVPLTTILDLIGTRTRVVLPGEAQATIIESAFPDGPVAMAIYLPEMMDHLSVNPDPTIPGRININQASRTILSGIPGLSDSALEEILGTRDLEVIPERPSRRHETWLLIEDIVTLEEMKSLIPFINAGGDVYRFQSVGYFDQEGASARAEVLLDATATTPKLLQWRDLSHLGRGYALETLGVGLLEE